MSPLYLLVLLFQHIGIILENIKGNKKRYDNIEERQKFFLFCLYIVDLGTIIGSLDKLNKTLKVQF